MITIISATNRPHSNTLKVAKEYAKMMEKQGSKPKLFSFEQLPPDIAFNELFDRRSAEFQQLIDEYIIPSEKYVMISPEYNGSFPGILKIFIDAMHPKLIKGKKIALIGVSSGRAGNLRGLDHLTGILHHVGVFVHPNKLPVSNISTLLDEQGNLTDERTIKVLDKHVSDVLAW